MKALGVLGTSSNSGKSWMTTALCAWLTAKGYRVAPFKAQNMSNNSFVTLDGKEIGRAQAVQAEACGLNPIVEMNPILLKPSGERGSQLIVLGEAQRHITAQDYYREIEQHWKRVTRTLEFWRKRVDVLVVEGAGSPVELNLKKRDIANMRPIQHLDGKWILMADIERGGVFAQIVGAWQLMARSERTKGLGVVVNKFRGNLELFADAEELLRKHTRLPYLGVLPFRQDLQPESEDSLCRDAEEKQGGALMAWVRFPLLSNSQDAQPWLEDEGVGVRWVDTPQGLEKARIIVLPGSKNTLSDLRWLRQKGLDKVILSAAQKGVPIIGICGGYQMLGETLCDPRGVAGASGNVQGLGLLPVRTLFHKQKEARQVRAFWEKDSWMAYELHMGKTELVRPTPGLIQVKEGDGVRSEGVCCRNIWGTYLHGFFESASLRSAIARRARLKGYSASAQSWKARKQETYAAMAEFIAERLNLESTLRYVES